MKTLLEPGHDQGGFRPIRELEPTPLFRERPRRDSDYVSFRDVDGFTCHIQPSVLRSNLERAREVGGKERIGRLAGRFCEDQDGPYTLVEDTVLNTKARSGIASVVAELESQNSIRREFEQTCPALDSVGWDHNHPPQSPPFFSTTDEETQSTWSNENAIGIVVSADLTGEAIKVFRGPRSRCLTVVDQTQLDRVIEELRSEFGDTGSSSVAIRPEPSWKTNRHDQEQSATSDGREGAKNRSLIDSALTVCILALALLLLAICVRMALASFTLPIPKVKQIDRNRVVVVKLNLDEKLSLAAEL